MTIADKILSVILLRDGIEISHTQLSLLPFFFIIVVLPYSKIIHSGERDMNNSFSGFCIVEKKDLVYNVLLIKCYSDRENTNCIEQEDHFAQLIDL